jgi:hypothetical protein
VNETVTAPAGTYTGCVRTRDYTPLEPGIEETKWHCAGAGLVREEGADAVNELVSIERVPPVTPSPQPATPVASATAAAPTVATGIVAPDTGGGDVDGGRTAIVWVAVVIAGLAVVAAAGLIFARAR